MLFVPNILSSRRLTTWQFYLKKLPMVQFLRSVIHRIRPKSLTPPIPNELIIETSGTCNLGCPLCVTGSRTGDLPKVFLTPDNLWKVLKQFPKLQLAMLYSWGEPLINSKFFDLMTIYRTHNIETQLDTNLSLRLSDDFLDKLTSCGLNVLRASIDGASQETYEIYRKYGNFKLAYDNLRKIREIQKSTGREKPVLYWKFLVHKHNEHEIDKAKKMAKAIDVPLLLDQFGLSDDIPDVRVDTTPFQERKKYWLPKNRHYLHPYYRGKTYKAPYLHHPCPWLFNSASIHPDGTVLPCCYVGSTASGMGNINEQPFEEIWNSPKYQYARSLFMPGVKVPRVPVICEICPIYQQVKRKYPPSQWDTSGMTTHQVS